MSAETFVRGEMLVRPKGRIGVGSTVSFDDDGLEMEGTIFHFGFTHVWIVVPGGNRFYRPRTDLTLVTA